MTGWVHAASFSEHVGKEGQGLGELSLDQRAMMLPQHCSLSLLSLLLYNYVKEFVKL